MPQTDSILAVADIGGTHARFALSVGGDFVERHTLRSADYPDLEPAFADYLGRAGVEPHRVEAAVAVACPAHGDRIELTNLDWSFSRAALERRLGLRRLVVLNDFEAQALALPELEEDGATVLLGEAGHRPTTAPRAVLGPGTGLGVASLVFDDGRRVALAGEGGHRDLAAVTEREGRVAARLREEYGRVSCERVISGPGLAKLYRTLCELDGTPPEELSPAEVVARSDGSDACREAVEMFCAQLGAVAGDLALTLGARGGVFLGGGVIGRMGDAFRLDAFAERFLDKGRFRAYMRAIPVYRIDHPRPGLVGAAWALGHGGRLRRERCVTS